MKAVARAGALWFALAVVASAALAQASSRPAAGGSGSRPEPGIAAPQTSEGPAAEQAGAAPTVASWIGPSADPGGVRSFLSGKGITSSVTYIGETLGVASGGIRRGAIYEGRLDVQLDADLDRLLGWRGASFHTNFFAIHGRGLSRDHVGNLLVASGIEALPSERLFELWLEQKVFDGQVAVRVGQLAADTEFIVSQAAGVFVNATFGWPTITAANLPSGGPAYPLATPGIRIKVSPSENATLLVGVFNGDPAGRAGPFDDPDPQRRERTNTSFRLRDPALLISEGALSYKLGSTELPGTAKLGYWHHFGRFDDQRRDGAGLSLADPATSGVPRRLRGNDGGYVVIDQAVYRVPGTEDGGATVFARVSGSPGDRNLIDLYADAGITYKGMWPGRPDDTFGVGIGYARISDRTRGFDRDAAMFAGAPALVRSSEAVIEVTYQAQVVPGWTVQPDFQYVFRPGGGAANPREANGGRIRDAAIFGLRTTIRY
jgi:porin